MWGGGGEQGEELGQSQDAGTTRDGQHLPPKAGTKKWLFLFFSFLQKQKDSPFQEALAEAAAAAWFVGDGSVNVDMLKANMLAAAKWRSGEGMRQAVSE